MTFLERIEQDLKTAMKNKEADRLSTLRMVKAAIKNREIEKRTAPADPSRTEASLTDEEALKVLQSLVKQRRDSIEQYQQAGRTELAEKEA
ncbi:MAG: GatB/YqeY domain-containing protein, partial [Blastocatellia bacterium]